MTTEGRLRTRQYKLGMFVMVLAIFTAGGTLYSNVKSNHLEDEASRQRVCLAQSFTELTAALQTRTENSIKINKFKDRDKSLLQAQFDALIELLVTATQNPEVDLKQRFLDETADFKKRRARVREQIDALEEAQKNSPVPPYPEGKCD
jgi:hypothetical protein